MATDLQSARTIFLDALELAHTDERERFLNSACAGDESLRGQVLRLLDVHGELNNFMDRPAAAVVTPTLDLPATEQVGATIGRYKLLEQIGEGGMGVVYVAEQTEPVRRRVALKIIKPGMDTRQVIARFEAERQALAMMDHPNIAKVLDGGTTGDVGQAVPDTLSAKLKSQAKPDPCPLSPGSGRPYFVMELVRGMPITDYCDQARLNPRGRLELFMTVCHAVQHAHQKGIIHRDLKPSNVLVTLHDSQPVVKVIDFGVAKATGQQLTERTIYTAFTELIGTPLYMSPEQAELSGLDVDTRSDVYSLGVLLYELLTGQTPFDRESLVKAGLDEVRRMIREDEPPRPSHRISTLAAEAGSTVSQKRGIDQRQLTRALTGELDWIVMKALEKDRNRRYESASAFAADIERYLSHEPVQAGPPSALYRFRKFARRRRSVLVAISLVTASLVAGIGVSLWQAAAANAARREAEANFLTARQAVDDMYVSVAEEWLNDRPYLTKLQRQFLEKAASFYETLLASKGMDAEARRQAAHVQHRLAKIRSAMHQADDPDLPPTMQRPDTKDLEKEIAHTQKAVARIRKNSQQPFETSPEDRKRELIYRLDELGDLLAAAERPIESRAAFDEALAEQRKLIEAAQKEVDKSPKEFSHRLRLHKELRYYAELNVSAGKHKAARIYQDRAQMELLGHKPDIQGLDIEGNKFKLSDYRGKVVVLAFFGDWGHDSRRMYPLERSLVEEYEGRPFVLLGVCSDSKEVLQKLIEQGDVTWRCWADGGIDGPITKAWGNFAWPLLFFIDHQGVIRREFPGAPSDEAEVAEFKETIETLVREAELASSPAGEVAEAQSEPP